MAVAGLLGASAGPSDEAYRESILEDIERDDIGNLVFELDGRIVANFVVAPVELASMHAGARPTAERGATSRSRSRTRTPAAPAPESR